MDYSLACQTVDYHLLLFSFQEDPGEEEGEEEREKEDEEDKKNKEAGGVRRTSCRKHARREK